MPKPPPPNKMALAAYGAQPEQSISRDVSRMNIQSSGEPRAGGARYRLNPSNSKGWDLGNGPSVTMSSKSPKFTFDI